MPTNNIVKNKSISEKFLVLLLILSFAALAGLESVLHNHDFDFEEVHSDCASCLWKQSNSQIDTAVPNSPISSFIQSFSRIFFKPPYISFAPVIFANRSPPEFL